ncbi:uncharacterized protein [Phyllobates terribilis]|uniref:uncharacterized protein n=1 Tax=Phyllobates terribilis TaxID=111132 RepID=UPI003CCA9200
MKIVKDIPKYNEKVDAFDNADIFESNTDKFNLNDEQKNKAFKVWLPSHMAKRLQVTPKLNDGNELTHSTKEDRLRQLLVFTTGDTPSVDILNQLSASIHEDPFAFLVKFEQAYRMVMPVGSNEELASMIKLYVSKFKYLDPVSVQLASVLASLQEATAFIDKIRRSMKRNQVKAKIAVVHEEKDRQLTLDRTQPRLKSTLTSRNRDYTEHRGKNITQRNNVHCYFCGIPGHLKWQCRKFLRAESEAGTSGTGKLGRENGLIPKSSNRPSAPSFNSLTSPRTDTTQTQSPYAPLIRQIREMTVKESNCRDSACKRDTGLLPSPSL